MNSVAIIGGARRGALRGTTALEAPSIQLIRQQVDRIAQPAALPGHGAQEGQIQLLLVRTAKDSGLRCAPGPFCRSG